MISKEEENKTRQVRENLRNQKSLYDTFKFSFEKIIFKQTSILKEYFELNINDA